MLRALGKRPRADSTTHATRPASTGATRPTTTTVATVDHATGRPLPAPAPARPPTIAIVRLVGSPLVARNADHRHGHAYPDQEREPPGAAVRGHEPGGEGRRDARAHEQWTDDKGSAKSEHCRQGHQRDP